jgi:hypothetical protein
MLNTAELLPNMCDNHQDLTVSGTGITVTDVNLTNILVLRQLPCKKMQFLRVAFGNSLTSADSCESLFRQGISFARKMTESHYTGAECDERWGVWLPPLFCRGHLLPHTSSTRPGFFNSRKATRAIINDRATPIANVICGVIQRPTSA